MRGAACEGLPTRIWFEDAWSDMRQAEWPEGAQRARGICCTCPAQEECLEGALERKEAHGIWGGTNPLDRRRFLRKKLDTRNAMLYFGFRQPEPPEADTEGPPSSGPETEGTPCHTK